MLFFIAKGIAMHLFCEYIITIAQDESGQRQIS